jgi:hypothetical protein
MRRLNWTIIAIVAVALVTALLSAYLGAYLAATFAVALVTALLSAYLGAYLAYHFQKKERIEENEQKVLDLRKLLYEDIITRYIELNELFTVIENALKIPRLDDIETVNHIVTVHQHALVELQRTDWYRNARAEQFIFIQLRPGERRAIAQIAGLQGTVVAVSGDKYVTLAAQVGRREIEPRTLIEFQKGDLESIISKIRQKIITGLDKELLLEVCPDENKNNDYMHLIFDEKRETGDNTQEKGKKQKRTVKAQ